MSTLARVLVVAVTLSVLRTAPQAQPTNLIDGRVVTGTGAEARPVRRARVTLSGGDLKASRTVDTDSQGQFRFAGLNPGKYKVSVFKIGFIRLESDAVAGAVLEMSRGGAIEGTISDPGGDPFPGAGVRALQIQPDGTRPRMIAQAYADDLGGYRLFGLPAADYIVEASSQEVVPTQLLMPGEKRGQPTTSYFPASETIEAAKPVRVTLGRDVTAIDVRLAMPLPVMDPAAPPKPPPADVTGTARIVGRVTDAATGKPIRNARLLLVPVDGGPAVTNWKRTDAQGHFEYAQLQPRRYRLTASADRLVQMEYGQKRPGETGVAIQLKDDQEFRADIALPRAGAIEGQILDEFGDGAPGILVKVARKQFGAGRVRLMPIDRLQNSQKTDDRGYYRVSALEPGEYYVVALTGVFANGAPDGGFAPTYNPGTTDAASGIPVTVTVGSDAAATFALVPAKTFTINGLMVDAGGIPVARGRIMLMTPDKLQRLEVNLTSTITEADGTFALHGVPAGQYTLQAFGRPGPDGPGNIGAAAFAWQAITVADSDVSDAVMKVTDGARLRGRILLEDASVAPPTIQQVRVSAIPVEFDSAPIAGGPSPATTNPDWSFEVTHLSGTRRAFVNVSSPGWTLKKLTLNGQDVTDTPIDFRGGDVDGLEVLLSARVASVTGRVADERGQTVMDYAVVIFPSDPAKWMDRSRFVRLVRPNQQGEFLARAMPPEDYLAIALPNVRENEWMDPAFLQQLLPSATRFVLSEGETKTLAVTMRKRP